MKKENIVTNENKKNFTIIPNSAIDDNNISLGALGLYIHMMKKPQDWKFYNSTLARECNIGKDKLFKLLNELHANEWIIKYAQQNTIVNNKVLFGANIYVIKFRKKEKLEDKFTMVDNKIFDSNISLEALALYTMMSSKPIEWNFLSYYLKDYCKCGKQKLSTILKELHDTGWVVKEIQINSSGGFSNNKYIIRR